MTLLDGLQRDWPVNKWAETTVIVAVSGGADSVSLLLALHSLKTHASGDGRLIVAHFNHALRGRESDADESFVVELAARLGVPCESRRVPLESRSMTTADDGTFRVSEDTARRARYEFLMQVAMSTGARYVATAHTADDQAETILHRILRGTGIDGLAGISRVREFVPGVTLIRPMLAIRRLEVLDYLRQCGQSFREDSSNTSLRYTRNRIRLELLPHLEREFNPQVRQALCKLGSLANEVNVLVKPRVDALLAAMPRWASRDACEIDCELLLHVEPYVVRQLLMAIWEQPPWPMRDMTFENWNMLSGMIASPQSYPAKIMLPGEVVVERTQHRLTMKRHGIK